MKFISIYQSVNKKKRGSSLLIAIFLSGLILTIGITASRLLLKDVSFAADSIMSEKAYYSAESGVESALWELRNEPVQHMMNINAPASINVEYDLSIVNKIEPSAVAPLKNKFYFTLNKLANQQFRLRYDANNSTSTSLQSPSNFRLKATPQGVGTVEYQWKFTCQDNTATKNTFALEKNPSHSSPSNVNDFLTSQTGCHSEIFSSCSNETFNTWAATRNIDKSSCFLMIQNLSDTPTKFTFSNTTMAPHQAKIIAIGKSADREKHIVFDYAQKNIGSLFNFTFFHTEIGL